MLEQLGNSPEDWEQRPVATRAALALLWQQNRMLQSRCAVYEQQVQRLTTEVERIKRLELEVAELREQLGRLLRAVVKCERAKTSGSCRQILQWERSLWTFVRMSQVEPTNNQAERSLRRAVMWRKKSFGTHQNNLGQSNPLCLAPSSPI